MFNLLLSQLLIIEHLPYCKLCLICWGYRWEGYQPWSQKAHSLVWRKKKFVDSKEARMVEEPHWDPWFSGLWSRRQPVTVCRSYAGPSLVFVNIDLLEHSNTHLYNYYLWTAVMARQQQRWIVETEVTCPQSKNPLVFDIFQKIFADHWSGGSRCRTSLLVSELAK